MPTISIIVPVYQTEKYLSRCVDSILAQSFTDFECILVNDGSPDGCPVICDEYAKCDTRISVIHQENAGTAKARSAGIDISVGEFIVFVDSDDVIPPNSIQMLYDKARKTGADIVCGNIRFLFKKREIIYKDVKDFSIPSDYVFLSLNNGLCGKIYKRKIFKNELCIPKSSYGEDLMVNIQIFSQTKRENIACVDAVVYDYDRRTDGITTRAKTFKNLPWQEYPPIVCYLWIHDFLQRNNHHRYDKFLRRMIRDGILSYITVKKNIRKSEIDIFYNKYYCPCTAKKELHFSERIIIPLYKKSYILGYIYVHIFNCLKNVRLKIKGMY